ncbi:MAG: hypothetical protein K2M87_06895 [Muribaculaceae bacterium]|nr:hypothetical protein [Muribaculaceae bacterium]
MKKIIFSLLALGAVMTAGAQTSRELVLTDKEGNQITYPADQVDGIMFTAQPNYLKLNEAYDCSYQEVGALGLYGLTLATNTDGKGNLSGENDFAVQLVLAGPWSDDVKNPKLPAGYYREGQSNTEWTFDVTKSSIIVNSENGPAPAMIISGTVDVREDGDGEYDIRLELTSFTGATVDASYKGQLNFPAGFGEFQPFKEDQNVTFTNAQGRFYGNWYYPFAADLSMLFYKGTVEDGTLKDGYMLDVTFYEPKPADEMDPDQKVADGVYELETRDAIAYTYLPFRYEAGERTDFLGQEVITKTRLTYYSPTGESNLGLIKGGTMTVSNNGTKFVFDFVTEEGIKVTGSFTGNPLMQNFCDNNEKAPKRPYSLLTEDVNLQWANGTVAVEYNDGHSILNDANTITFWITDPLQVHGDYISFDLLTESETLPDGTFTVGSGLTANLIIPGEIDYGGQPLFSWYGNLDEVDADGYNTKMAPIASGTVTISTLPSGERKFVIDVKGDANHSIKGEYSGVVYNYNDIDSATAAKLMNKVKKARRAQLNMRKK